MKRTVILMAGLMTLAMACGAMAEDSGGVSFSRNRMVFPAGEKAISLSVINHGSGTYLVQAGVSGSPDTRVKAPFVVTPPLFRLDANSENAVRIVGTGSDLPQDRESIFYFNGLVIPSGTAPGKEEGEQKMSATLSISMRSVLKLFWRPAGLSPAPDKAPDAMRFERTDKGMKVINPTPYYQSFAQLEVNGQEPGKDGAYLMVSPFSERVVATSAPARTVSWSVMNDFGGATPLKTQPVTEPGAK